MNVEEPFWKVIHNKFLFNKIFEIIKQTEWNNYEDHSLIGKSKIKFQYITSLEWMLSNKQHELLKCKLQSPNEHIEFKRNGLELLFKKEEKEYQQQQQQKQELFQLILQFKRNGLIHQCNNNGIDLIQLSIKNENNEFLNQLISSNSFEIKQQALEYSISTSNVSTVKLLFSNLIESNEIDIIETIKSNSLKLAYSNSNYKDEMVEFILNSNYYNQFYQKDDESNKIDNYNMFSLKSINNEMKLIELNAYTIPNSNGKLKFDNLISKLPIDSIDSVLLHFKVYLKYFNNEYKCSTITKSINNIINNQTLNEIEKTKQLFNLLIIKSKSLKHYEHYLNKYDNEQINEFQIQGCTELLFKTTVLPLFQVDSNKTTIKFINFLKNYVSTSPSLPHQQDTQIKQLNDQILHSILKIQDPILYKQAVEIINSGRQSFEIKLPNEFHPILNEFSESFKYGKQNSNTIIKDTEFIDLMNSNEWLKTAIESRFQSNMVLFNDFKVANYYFKNCQMNYNPNTNEEMKEFLKAQIYFYSFYNALKQCNILELESIKSLGYIFSIQHVPYDLLKSNLPFFNDDITLSKVESLLQYLGENGYSNFNYQLIIHFINRLFTWYNLKIYNANNINELGTFINQIKVQFSKKPRSWLTLFSKAITRGNLNLLKYLLSNIEQIGTEYFERFEGVWETEEDLYSKLYHVETGQIYYSKFDKQISISILDQLFNSLKVNSNGIDSYKKEMFETVIEFTYKRLTQSKGLSFTDIQNYLPLISQYKFRIKPSFLYQFYWLNIKSPKLIKYIIDKQLQFSSKTRKTLNNYYYNERTYSRWSDNEYDIQKYFNQKQFTFEYISENNWIHLLYQLITETTILSNQRLQMKQQQQQQQQQQNIQLPQPPMDIQLPQLPMDIQLPQLPMDIQLPQLPNIQPLPNNLQYPSDQELLNSNLIYFLDINRFDLFKTQFKKTLLDGKFKFNLNCLEKLIKSTDTPTFKKFLSKVQLVDTNCPKTEKLEYLNVFLKSINNTNRKDLLDYILSLF